MAVKDIISKVHLIISVLIVIPVALVYGVDPSSQFNIYLETNDEHNLLKAIAGLYLGFSLLWLLGIFKALYLKLALISNFIFMIGLAFGRLLSIIVDGMPSQAFILGTMGEFILGFYGLWVLGKRYYKKQ